MWPFYHKSKETLQERNEIRSIPIFLQYAVQSAGLQSETRRQSVVARNNNRGDVEESADKKIKSAERPSARFGTTFECIPSTGGRELMIGSRDPFLSIKIKNR